MVRARFLCFVVLLVVVSGCLSPAISDDRPSTTSPTADTDSATVESTPVSPVGTPAPSTNPNVTATVVDIVDGDTIKVEFEDGTRETVRLLGVDTPEVFSENTPDEFEGVPETDAGRQCLRRYGDSASEFATATLAEETVRLGFDENEGQRGYYGRLLAYVYVDGEQFNYRLVAEGHARMYDSNFVERERYAAAERAAQDAGRGVWSCATAVADGGEEDGNDGATENGDSDGEATDDGRLSVRLTADADGPDGDNLNGEYVVLTNSGSSSLDVSGWTVADAANHVYTVPEGTTIDVGASLTIYTGSGRNTDTELYWGRNSPVWNNDGDTVTVRDGDDATVIVYRG